MKAPDQPLRVNGATDDILLLRLYVAGTAPNSLRAAENLRVLCDSHFSGRYRLEIVDVLKEPLRALNDDILVTPTLVKLGPRPTARVIGDLSDERRVLSALGSSAEKPVSPTMSTSSPEE
jgi:circadian clock protein KaiB